MDPSAPQNKWLAALPGLLALSVIAGLGGSIVWVGNTHGWLEVVRAFLIGGFAAVIIGGIVGVSIIPSLTALTVFTGLFEGMVWDGSAYGLAGAVLGGIVGFVAGPVAAMLPLMLLHLVLIALGIDPTVEAATPTDDNSSINGGAENRHRNG